MSKRKKRRLRPEATRALVVLIVLGICIYIALATTAGNYIAENVIAPVFRMINEKGKGNENISTENAGLLTDSSPFPALDENDVEDGNFGQGSDDGGLQSDANPSEQNLALLPKTSADNEKDSAAELSSVPPESGQSNSSSEELHLEEFTSYALQMGAFSSDENARSEAENLRSRGAAGYVYHDGHYRVFASVYQDESDAQAVRKQLEDNESLESSVFVIHAPGATLRVTASEEGLKSVKEAFSALETARDELYSLCTDIDRKNISEGDARSKLKKLAEDARKPAEALDGTGEVGTALQDELIETSDELRKVAEMKDDGIAFSTEMKYALVRQSCAYADLMKKITGSN